MSPLILVLTIWFLGPSGTKAALPACAAGVTCPTGGLWSEWVTTKPCATDCGACSSQYYTRTCLSTSVSCACTGDNYKYSLCNTQSCLYPSQRSCCEPFLPMIINGSYQCGPQPKDTSSPATPCCPVGGLWSDWSGYLRNTTTNQWFRTRQCVSSTISCPCTGSSINTITSACPCADIVTAAQVHASCGFSSAYLYYSDIYTVDTVNCVLIASLKSNNYNADWPCVQHTTYQPFSTTLINLLGTDGKCSSDTPADCGAILQYTPAVTYLNSTFTCDPNIAAWRYDFNSLPVTGYLLAQQSYAGGG